jgi:hypothetical protein
MTATETAGYYEAFYADEKLEALDDCRVELPGERLWGRVLPNGQIILNNEPALGDESGDFRVYDVVQREAGKWVRVHRHYNAKILYRYEGSEHEELDVQIRKRLSDALKPLGRPAFFWSGMAHVFIKDATDATTKVEARANRQA